MQLYRIVVMPGHSSVVVIAASKTITPTYVPDTPAPHIARLTIKASINGAAPQIAEPTSKKVAQRIYVHLALNCNLATTTTGAIFLASQVKGDITCIYSVSIRDFCSDSFQMMTTGLIFLASSN